MVKSIGKHLLIMQTYLDGRLTNTKHYHRTIYKDKFGNFWINSGDHKRPATQSGVNGLEFVAEFKIRSVVATDVIDLLRRRKLS